MNIKEIVTTLAVLTSGSLALAGCGKEQPATEVPGGATAPAVGEGSCGEGHTEEGHCAGADGADAAADDGADGEASCSGEGEADAEGEASCSGK